MKKYAIIVAGGSGTRMNLNATNGKGASATGNVFPKQFLLLNKKPVLFHTLERFYLSYTSIKIILVLPKKHFIYWESLCKKYKFRIPHSLTEGGKERFFSVKNALKFVDEDGVVAIHDGVRPLIRPKTIRLCFDTAIKKGNAVPVIPVNDSIRKKNKNGNVSVSREDFFIVQTPQCFNSVILKKAYRQRFLKSFTDDASVVEKSGVKIHLVEGARENIKITTPLDLTMAEFFEKSV